jgi:DNA replication and repair protein RecF
MQLNTLQVHFLRSLTDFSLEPARRFNYLFGPNGVGKTSVLEAIYMLGRGRSFRSRQSRSIIQYGQEELVLYGEMLDPAGEHLKVGISKPQRGSMQLQLDGERLASVNPLVEKIASLIINAESFQLLCGEPDNRRQFLDWGMFHVEKPFLKAWREYTQVLKQRNSLLQKGQEEGRFSPWDEALVIKGNILSAIRIQHVAELLAIFEPLCEKWLKVPNIRVTYWQGWDEKYSFEKALSAKKSLDIARGFTQVGPHRADLKITVGNIPAKDLLSRGQQKLLICLLFIAQCQLLQAKVQKYPIILADDLGAELDSEGQEKVLHLFKALDCQVFLTAIGKSLWEDHQGIFKEDSAMFHVEHC